jgi:hypothetical protein
MGDVGGGSIPASIQASGAGGAPVTGAKATKPGKLVILAGADITNTANVGSITVGGELEIHQGGNITVSGTTPLTFTQGSKAVVYGTIKTGSANTFNGTLDIKAGGSVDADADLSNLVFGDTVTLAGGLTLPGIGNVTFEGALTVEPGITLELESGNTVAFNKTAAFKGYLDATGATVTVGPNGWLAIEATGALRATNWNDINGGTPASLRAAFTENEPASATNKRVTIAEPGSGSIYLAIGITPATYPDLRWFAAQEKLHLNTISYSVSIPSDAEILEIASGNHVSLTHTAIPDVSVKAGGALTLTGAVTEAGDITVVGAGRAAREIGPWGTAHTYAAPFTASNAGATFENALSSLTVGDGTVATTVYIGDGVTIGSTIFGDASPEIKVKKNGTLYVGNGTNDPDIDPAGTITLEAGDTAVSGGKFISVGDGTTASFTRTETIDIGVYASFDGTSLGDYLTFEGLSVLKVNGKIEIASNATDLFKTLQKKVSGSTQDVAGTGEAIFNDWNVDGADKGHAFDQLLGISKVTIESLVNVPNTSGFSSVYTPDRATVTSGEGYLLTVTDITVPAGGLTLDRHVNVLGAITNITSANRLILASGVNVYANGVLTLGGSTQTQAVLALGVSGALTAGTGVFTTGTTPLTVNPGSTLLVPGTLAAGASANITAGAGTGAVVLIGNVSGNSYLKDGSITSDSLSGANATATIVVNLNGNDGKLSTDGASTVGIGSVIEVKKGGIVEGRTSSTITFGTTGANIGVGTLLATGDTASLNATDANTTTVIGNFTAAGNTPLTVPAAKNLNLSNSAITLVGLNTEYDTVRLTDSNIVGLTEFIGSATAANIKVTGTISGGSLLTKGSGVLTLGSTLTATLQTTGTADQTLTGVTLDGANGLTAGSLILGASSVLTLDGTLKVGKAASAGTGLVVGLDVSTTGAKIVFHGASGKIQLLAVAATQDSGSLKISSALKIDGLNGISTTATAYGTGLAGAVVDGEMETNDIIITSTGEATHVATSSGASAIPSTNVASGVVTIDGLTGNTITSTTKVGLRSGT